MKHTRNKIPSNSFKYKRGSVTLKEPSVRLSDAKLKLMWNMLFDVKFPVYTLSDLGLNNKWSVV